MSLRFTFVVGITLTLTQPVAADIIYQPRQPTFAEEFNSATLYIKNLAPWVNNSPQDLSFKKIFPKPIYKKTYFGAAIMGVTIVGAGAFTYFTAGAGAPAAATGTSTVATWVAGGGAGSYMAGLSTIGSWFGGNAILGASILNGISIGVIGGGTSFAALPAIGKVAVMTSVTASSLDGVALISNPDTKNLSYQVRLLLPTRVGSETIKTLVEDINEIDKEMMEADRENDATKYKSLAKRKEVIVNRGVILVKKSLTSTSTSNEDLIVLAVFAKNVGDYTSFNKLINKVRLNKVKDIAYINYLRGVSLIENGNNKVAEKTLLKSYSQNPYAIEAPLLLVNLLGQKFKLNEERILGITKKIEQDFSSNKYESGYSLVSLYYRVGTLYLINKRYDMARHYYEMAIQEMSWTQKYIGNKQMLNLVKLGVANSMFGKGEEFKSRELFNEIIKSCDNENQKKFFRSQYAATI